MRHILGRMFRPKHRINPKFVHFMNENDQIMTQDFASVLLRSASPNFRLIMLEVDSTFDRL